MRRLMLSAVAFTCLTLPVVAAEEVAKSSGERLLESLLPIVIIFTIVWLLLRRVGNRN